ncbi:hypothetical protein PanWU01x14_082670, partial [Parasponia andersonii]
YHVTNIGVINFDYFLANKTLQFNLYLNITIENLNKRIGIHFMALQHNAYYDGKLLDPGIRPWNFTCCLSPIQSIILRAANGVFKY